MDGDVTPAMRLWKRRKGAFGVGGYVPVPDAVLEEPDRVRVKSVINIQYYNRLYVEIGDVVIVVVYFLYVVLSQRTRNEMQVRHRHRATLSFHHTSFSHPLCVSCSQSISETFRCPCHNDS
jgi:hypothetical protein